MIPYDQYLATKESQDVPTEASPIPPIAAYMLQTLTDLTTNSVHKDYMIPYDQYLATKEIQDVPTEASPIPPIAAYMLQTKAQLSQPTLYDGHRLLQPGHAPVKVSDSYETLFETKVSHMKMSQKQGHVTPVDYTKLNALYDQFVPQKELSKEQELSREQVYWLSTSDIASQSSDPPKLVTLFIYTRPVNSEVKFQKFKECASSNATPSNAIFEITKLKDQLQERDETIRNLESQFNISRMLKIGSPVGSLDKNALETEITQLKDNSTSLRIQNDGGSGTKVSGPKTPEKPKVLAPGMYAISSKYITPPRRGDWAPPTPRKKQVTFQEPPRVSTTHTKQPTINNHEQPNVNVIVSTGLTPAAETPHVARPKMIPKNVRKTDITVAYRIVPQ
nr:hypothetical protein [Tanacetum cinerariifolium]